MRGWCSISSKGTDIGVFVGISHNDYQGIQGTPWEHSGHQPALAHRLRAQHRGQPHFLLLQSARPERGHGYGLLLRADGGARGLRAHPGRPRRHGAGGRRHGDDHAGRLHRLFAGLDAFAGRAVQGVRCFGERFRARRRRGHGAAEAAFPGARRRRPDPRGHRRHGAEPGRPHERHLAAERRRRRPGWCATPASTRASIRCEIGFVEAHGTGTAVGDPIEAHALAEALCEDRPADAPLLIGSVKTNLGHLETAAGVAGLVKAMLVLKHGRIPASLHFKSRIRNIDFDALKLRVPTTLEPFPEANGRAPGGREFVRLRRRECARPARRSRRHRPHREHAEEPSRARLAGGPLRALGGSAAQLPPRGCARGWRSVRNANGSSPMLPDLAYTLGARRNHHAYRLTLVANSMTEAIAGTRRLCRRRRRASKARTAFTPRPEHAPRIAFVMSGQGPQWWGMGRELMQHEPVFRQAMERCAAAMRAVGALLAAGRAGPHRGRPRRCTARRSRSRRFSPCRWRWRSCGNRGASSRRRSSAIASARSRRRASRAFSALEEGARVIVLRARFMDDCARGEGTMLAVGLDEEAARALDRAARPHGDHRGVQRPALADARRVRGFRSRRCWPNSKPQGVFARLVRVDHPFHHPLMRPAAEALEEALADLDAAGGDGAVFQHGDRAACAGGGVRRRRIGAAACGSRCNSPRR